MLVRTFRGGPVLLLSLFCTGLASAGPLSAQNPEGTPIPVDSTVTDSILADSAATEGLGLPLFAVLGFGYGTRMGDCVLCANPQDNRSFVGHLSVGRPLGKGVGVGLDASVWMKGRPGTPGPADSTGVPVATSLTNMLGNVSVSFSYDIWHTFVRAGFGLAFGRQDLEFENPEGAIVMQTASGMGVGYSLGGGFTIPLASVVSLALFGNWNVGFYDMRSPQGLTVRGAKHQWFEFGVGVALR